MRVAWLTIDRLRSGRDIRLSTATMRALNSRRPRSPSVHRLVPSRPTLCFLLVLCVLQDTRARSVPHDDDGGISATVEATSDSGFEVAAGGADEEARGRSLTEDAYVGQDGNAKDDGSVVIEDGRNLEERLVAEQSEKIRIEAAADEGSVAKKRRRNDVSLAVGKSMLQDGEGNPQKDEGIRRFDAQVDDSEELGQRRILDDGVAEDGILHLREDAVEHPRGLIDVKLSPAYVNRPVDEDEEKYGEISDDLRRRLDDAVNSAEKIEGETEGETGQVKNPAEANEAQIEMIDGVSEEVRNDLRSLELGDSDEGERNPEGRVVDEVATTGETGAQDQDLNREHRQLAETPGKSKYRSSTVYLSAEEGSSPGRDQESIVDGQIKRLISIRDDALESAGDGVKPVGDEEEAFLAGKSVGIDVTDGGEEDEEIRNQRSSDTSAPPENLEQPSLTTETGPDRLQRWRNQAAMLQEQIRNRTFLQYLREHAVEVLPDIPKFTEGQLLETLKNIWQSRVRPSSNETYSASLNASAFSHDQVEIIKCAEQLTEAKQRQTFVQNITECVRGLSVINCLRVFVWPVVLDNMPQSISQTLSNLPIEINLMDLFQRAKTARSENSVHRPRLLTPESVVFAILKNALDSNDEKHTHDQRPIYIDSRNETLRRLLTIGQLQILQMAEKLLPGEARREYSDRMFSCVRRFEYFSCVKYFAWPMVKQYHPDLPDFPDYQAWYPSIAYYPQYPIVPFPSFVETTGELPEVVDADATRMRKPKPEAVIVNILQNTLREHAKVPPPSVAHNADSYIALLPPEQLLSIHMAEQLLPTPYRPEFVQKTVKCIQEFSYMTCIRYSTWPTVKQFSPALPPLPDLTGWLPDWSIPQVFGSYLPELPSFADLTSFIPGLGGGTPEQPPQSGDSTGQAQSGRLPTTPLRQYEISPEAIGELESKIIEILTRVRNSLKIVPESSPLIISSNVIVLTTITEKQINILKLAESILPPPVRAPLVTQVFSCLQASNDFINCTRYVIWPTVALYVPNLPEFPSPPSNRQPSKQDCQQTPLKDKDNSHQINEEQWDNSQNAANPNVKIISRTKYPQSNTPVISVTGTRFVPIFTEHPESVILNILRSIQLTLPNAPSDPTASKVTSTQHVADLLNDQQEKILRATEDLLPEPARPSFFERMIECVRKESFLVCSREVLWPTLSEYFPRLPSFPNFGANSQATDSKPTLPPNLTDTSPFSETDVKVGQHGDATVTITDTRFYPIFTEHPENVILNILRAVQHATPGLLNSVIRPRSPEVMAYFTEQQGNIVQVAESLLPESVRPVFVDRMVTCVRESTFLECTRDIAWPTIAQFFPRLPNFPNFGGSQSMPRTKLGLSSILLRNAYSESQPSDEKAQDVPKSAMESVEDKIEAVLKELLSEEGASTRLGNSYLDADNPVIGDLLTAREMNIVKLTEKAIPDPLRRTYITNMLECVRSNNFMTCTQHISWPTLKQTSPALPSFDQLFGQFPGLAQFPDLAGQIPAFPGVGNYPFAELPSQITAIPGGIQGAIPGIPSGVPQFPGLPEFPSLGGIGFPSYVKHIPSGAPETKPQQQTNQPRLPPDAEQTNQISGVSVAADTPSVDEQGTVPGYLGQPSSILIDISKEKVHLSDIEHQRDPSPESVPSDQSKKRERRRRSTERLSNFYYETDGKTAERASETTDSTFPNITESEFLQLLINISRSKATSEEKHAKTKTEYFVDTLNSTIKNSLTADQYEILKVVEDLNEDHTTNRGLLTRVVQCIRSFSFIRCMGIFIWPVITSTVPSLLGLPSLPAIPGLGLLGRSTESEVQNFFGMSTSDFEKELLERKDSVENIFLNWYKRLMEDKFQANIGFLRIKGYGNGEVGISFNSFREGRATKIKDNKNLPSILTIISDIMEEVLDQRPDNEKIKKDKEKRERSLDDVQEADFQLLRESDEYADIKRSMNDDQIITMFLDKIKANASDFADGDVTQYLNMEDAYNAFGVLFGTRLNEKFASRLKTFTEEHLRRSLNRKDPEDHAKGSSGEELKVIPLKEKEISYDLEKESAESQEQRKREHRAKSEFKSFLSKYSDKYVRNIAAEESDDPDHDNKIKDTAESTPDKNPRSELRLQLPSLREDVMSRKITSTVIHFGRAMKMKIGNMMPGIGFVISFLIQTALAHARAAASMAGMISNMALASAMFGMLRQSLFGSDNPKVKYVYDNDKTGPGITWPYHGPYYHGK
ncbi:PREDICTED: uncharacterized protein LOC106743119 [Dinoponera quadriceps]|uniref:Uncharacterized protein LOC106743119 n=1 Tax=Dinoponera quadriceps TaxID=609295 RepID=A0A6P3X1C7_DINQU|nr:PREDICTED: uncharacterized protein LOC106743119 [Dinoponera quadriceps]